MHVPIINILLRYELCIRVSKIFSIFKLMIVFGISKIQNNVCKRYNKIFFFIFVFFI